MKMKPKCDWQGCKNQAYAEVYPGLLKKGAGWSYLCRRHYYEEQRRLKWKLPAYILPTTKKKSKVKGKKK